MLKIKVVQTINRTGLIIILILNQTLAHSQKNMQHYEKNKIEDNTVHEVYYDYFIVKSDTIKNKKYQSLIFHYEPDSISTIRKLQLNYSNGILDGPFYLEKANFYRSDSFPSYREFQVQHSIRGNSIFAHGNYSQGVRTGLWEQYELTINDRFSDTLATISFQFPKSGEWNGNFNINDKSLVIAGQFANNFANGNWSGTYFGKPVLFIFDNGILGALSIGDSILKLNNATEQFLEYDMHEYLDNCIYLNSMYRTSFSDEVLGLSTKINLAIRGFVPNRNLTISNNRDFTFSTPKIKVPIFELSTIDQESLKKIIEDYSQLTTELEDIITNPLMLFSLNDNKKFTESKALFELIAARLTIWKPLIDVSKTDWIKHIDWSTISPSVVNAMNKFVEESYTFNGETFSVILSAKQYVSNETPLTNLKNQLFFLKTKFEEYKSLMEGELTEMQFGEDLKELNQDFASSILKFNLNIAEIEETEYNQKYINGFQQFHNLLVTRFRTANTEASLHVLDDLLNQSNQLNELLKETAAWEKVHTVIEKRYSYLYLDPNTFEERIEILYAQLFKTYERKLMPFAFDQLNFKFNNFNEFKASFDNIRIIQERMLTLLDENPRKLNRKLKNRDTMDKVTQKMGLILN